MSRTAELNQLTKPFSTALSSYFAQDYRISFGVNDPVIQKNGHQIILDESGKVKSFIANGKTALKGKANIKQALAAIGLSALAVSASASTSEVAEVAQETLAPRANFKAKAWAQQGAR